MKKILSFLLLLAAPLSAFEIIYTEKGATRRETAAPETRPIGFYLVAWPFVDLRREPKPVDSEAALRKPYEVDNLQETQLVYGEAVVAYESRNGWMRVEAPEQPEHNHNNRWQGYPGWVPEEALFPQQGSLAPNATIVKRYARVRSGRWPWSKTLVELPMGSRVFVPLKKKKWMEVTGLRGTQGWMRASDILRRSDYPQRPEDVRRAVMAAASQFLKEPYYWGGRTGHRKSDGAAPSGVDCSALVNLGFRAAGFEVPRDAHEQFMASKPVVATAHLQPGDLIFLAKETHPEKMTHVMLYAGGEEVLEAVHEFNTVRRVTMEKKLGRPLASLKPGDRAAGYVVYFGRLVP